MARARTASPATTTAGGATAPGGPSSEYVRGFSFTGGQYVLQVHFDDQALPVRCRRFAQTSTGAARGARKDLALSGRHGTVHLVEQGVRAGLLGIDWDWE